MLLFPHTALAGGFLLVRLRSAPPPPCASAPPLFIPVALCQVVRKMSRSNSDPFISNAKGAVAILSKGLIPSFC